MGLPFGFDNISIGSYLEHLKLDNLKGRDIEGYNRVMNFLAERFTRESYELYQWDEVKADLHKLHSALVSDLYEFDLIRIDFSWENFKSHFVPVPGQPLIPIPWIGNLNLLADLLVCLKRIGAITLSYEVHIQAQKHFLWKGKRLNTSSFANAFKPNGAKSNETIEKIIRLITK